MDYEPTYGASPSYDSYETTVQELETRQMPLVDEPIVIKSGAGKLPRGAVLGQITATKKYVLCNLTDEDDEAITDGSQVPKRVLAVAVDATAGDVKAPGYRGGQFIWQALTVGEGVTYDVLKAAWAETTRDVVKAS